MTPGGSRRGGPGDRRGGPPVDRGGPGDRRGGPPVDRGGPGDRRRIERRPAALFWLVAGTLALLACAQPVHADRVEPLEADAFRLINDLPSIPFPVVWVPMQLGNFLVVPAAVLAALAFRRWRLAGGLALAGAG